MNVQRILISDNLRGKFPEAGRPPRLDVVTFSHTFALLSSGTLLCDVSLSGCDTRISKTIENSEISIATNYDFFY